jgi:hypothetical protein
MYCADRFFDDASIFQMALWTASSSLVALVNELSFIAGPSPEPADNLNIG